MVKTADVEEAGKPSHPGSGRFKTRARPKGRQVDGEAIADVCGVLGDAPRDRDQLIEHLHRLHDHFGHLSARHVAALAEEMRLAQVEVYEVASFYAHFDLVADGDEPPPKTVIRVCDGPACRMAGAMALMGALRATMGRDVRVEAAPCVGACDTAPAVIADRRRVSPATAETVSAALATPPPPPMPTPPAALRADGGYDVLTRALSGHITRESVIDALETSGLRGMGGAGFPTGRKWRFVAAEPGPRLVAVNADEGEPGTFKDRHFLETALHKVLEGTLIAAWAMEASDTYIYLRDEYPHIHTTLGQAIADVTGAGLSPHTRVHLRRGAGAYVCGEESAMLESLEGKRGLPRHKPPFPSVVGLFGRPTLINNVETLRWVPEIVTHGPDWWSTQGVNGAKGLRAYSVSGRVREPGVKIVPAGLTVRELIDQHCGGMPEGHTFKAYLPGGASGGILPASLGDIPLDFGQLEKHGCFIGSAAVIILSDHDDMRAFVTELLRFFEDESCGQCTPCRVGTGKAVALLGRDRLDEPLLRDLSRVMRTASICGLGQAAMNPLLTSMKHFRAELGLPALELETAP